MTFLKFLFIPLLIFTKIDFSEAQKLDSTFTVGLLSNGPAYVSAIARRDDGKVVVVGAPVYVNNQLQKRIYRLNPDLTLDETFNASLDEGIVSRTGIDFFSDGRMILVGDFQSVNGEIVHNIVTLKDDGTIDASFETGSGFDSEALSVKVENDKAIVLGTFETYNDVNVSSIIRLVDDGGLDPSFQNQSGIRNGNSLGNISIQEDGKILAASDGNFYLGGKIFHHIVRFEGDGTLDDSFNYSSDQYRVHFATTLDDGKILGVGVRNFDSPQEFQGLVRINSDGSIDESYIFPDQNINIAFCIFKQKNGKVLVGDLEKVIRVHSDGSIDDSYSFNHKLDLVNGVIEMNDGSIVFGGASGLLVTEVAGEKANLENITLLKNPVVSDFVPHTGGDLLFGGDFFYRNDPSYLNFIKTDNGGNLISNFKYLEEDPIDEVETRDDGSSFVAHFKNLNLIDALGKKDEGFNMGDFSGSIHDIQSTDDGKLLVATSLSSFDGSPTNTLFRFNSDGSLDNTFNAKTNVDIAVYRIHIQRDGKILVGGFGSAHLERLLDDGRKDTTFNIGSGPNASVSDIVMDESGNIFICGGFTTFDSEESPRLAKLSSEGILDKTFVPFENEVRPIINSIAVQRDGKLLLGGTFSQLGGKEINSLARLNLDGSLDESFMLNFELCETISKIVIHEGNIFVAGAFVQSLSPFRAGVVKLTSGLKVPENLSAQAISTSRISLSWAVNSYPDSSRVYILERATSQNGPFETIATLEGGISFYLDSLLQKNTSYHYRIMAANNISKSVYSQIVSASTLAKEVITLTVDEKNKHFTCYPNPARDVLNISLVESHFVGNLSVSVFDGMGRKLIEDVLWVENAFSKTYRLKGFRRGVFYVSIRTKEFSQTEKLVVR